MRLDQFIQQKFNLESRHQAQRLIKEGLVTVAGKVIEKNSYEVTEADLVTISDTSILKYVSRGGLKLEHALMDLALSVEGLYCLDVGQSTGGFTDCLLQAGAKKVVGVEVGHSQLHEKLKGHAQIQSFEKTHILEIELKDISVERFDMIVVDLSFISFTKVVVKLKQMLKPHGILLALIKPQFEVGSAALSKAGLVKDPAAYPWVEARVREALQNIGFEVKQYFAAFPKGGDGNQEFFVFALNESL